MWIQVLLIASVVSIGGFFMRRTGADSHLAIRRILFGLFVAAAIASILFPGMLTWIAHTVGVGRGADLLLYVLIIMFLLSVYTQHRRHSAHQRAITTLARNIALSRAETPNDPAPISNDSTGVDSPQ